MPGVSYTKKSGKMGFWNCGPNLSAFQIGFSGLSGGPLPGATSRWVSWWAVEGFRLSRRGLAKRAKAAALFHSRVAKVPLYKAISNRLGSQDWPMWAKLGWVGLIEAESASTPTTLRAFVDSYADMKGDAKESTREQHPAGREDDSELFGEGCRIDSITAGDAEEFRAWMVGKRKARLAENTARRTYTRAKQLFAHAVYKGMIPKNPFTVLKRLQVTGDRNRQQFVTRDVIEKVLKACPATTGGCSCCSADLAVCGSGRRRICDGSTWT